MNAQFASAALIPTIILKNDRRIKGVPPRTASVQGEVDVPNDEQTDTHVLNLGGIAGSERGFIA